MSKGFASKTRIVLLAGGLFACFGVLSVRLVFLHVVDREELLRHLQTTRYQILVEPARRGDILDARGAKLATSTQSVVLAVDPHALDARQWRMWPELASLTGIPLEELRQLFIPRYREPAAPAPVGVTLDLAAAVSAPAPAPAPASATSFFSLPPAADPAETPVAATAAPAKLDPKTGEPVRQRIRYVVLREDLAEETAARIRALGRDGRFGRVGRAGFQGLVFQPVYRRSYPNRQLASHLVGFVSKDERPAAGMEVYANTYLKGHDGWREGERDGRGRELAQFRSRHVPPTDGFSVRLSIDTAVQDIVEEELAALGRRFEPLRASIIVSDPRDGFILGMANYPTFDPNDLNEAIAREEHWRQLVPSRYGVVPEDYEPGTFFKNAAVASVYEPGSVFKIVAVAAALEEGLATSGSVFDVTLPRFDHRGRSLSLPADDHRFKTPHALPLAEAVAHSSNRAAAQLGLRLGEEKFHAYTRAFGFGERLGFPVGGEVAGLLRPLAKWDPIDITRVPIGHSISATALQMHQAMTVIANGGVLLRPQVIREIRDTHGDVVFRYDRQEIRRVVSERTARTVATMLTGVASSQGTAPLAAIPGFDVAGKTGTTIKLVEETLPSGKTKLVYTRKHHVASFVGFFPAGNPQIAISVIVDDADHKAHNGVAYGGAVAAPSFKRIGERLIPIRNIRGSGAPLAPDLLAVREGAAR